MSATTLEVTRTLSDSAAARPDNSSVDYIWSVDYIIGIGALDHRIPLDPYRIVQPVQFSDRSDRTLLQGDFARTDEPVAYSDLPLDGEDSGIGLAICRSFVEAHGGRIWAELQPGLGTHVKFTLELPTHTEKDALV